MKFLEILLLVCIFTVPALSVTFSCDDTLVAGNYAETYVTLRCNYYDSLEGAAAMTWLTTALPNFTAVTNLDIDFSGKSITDISSLATKFDLLTVLDNLTLNFS